MVRPSARPMVVRLRPRRLPQALPDPPAAVQHVRGLGRGQGGRLLQPARLLDRPSPCDSPSQPPLPAAAAAAAAASPARTALDLVGVVVHVARQLRPRRCPRAASRGRRLFGYEVDAGSPWRHRIVGVSLGRARTPRRRRLGGARAAAVGRAGAAERSSRSHRPPAASAGAVRPEPRHPDRARPARSRRTRATRPRRPRRSDARASSSPPRLDPPPDRARPAPPRPRHHRDAVRPSRRRRTGAARPRRPQRADARSPSSPPRFDLRPDRARSDSSRSRRRSHAGHLARRLDGRMVVPHLGVDLGSTGADGCASSSVGLRTARARHARVGGRGRRGRREDAR